MALVAASKGAQIFATLDVEANARETEDLLGVTAGVVFVSGAGIAGSVRV